MNIDYEKIYAHAFFMPLEKARRLKKLTLFNACGNVAIEKLEEQIKNGVADPLEVFYSALVNNICTFI